MGLKDKIKNFPDSPGVYLMKNALGEIIYIGKATSLKERVRSYFDSNLPRKTQIQMLEVADISYQKTESPLEALLLETRLIKKYAPKFNIKERDDKSKLYVHITREDFPRIELLRETDLPEIKKNEILYGPFLSSKSISKALELIRKIVPFRSCRVLRNKKCLYGFIGLCDAPCVNGISKEDYKKQINKIRNFFEGRKSRVLASLQKELKVASKNLAYEKAAKIRDQIFALEHLKEMFAIRDEIAKPIFSRVEGYDISNISGAFATGSMVVFIDGVSEKSEYRKFKIRNVKGADDTGMLSQVLERRFKNDWPLPELILVDGGRAQVNAAAGVLRKFNLNIPVVGLAKGPDRKGDKLITSQTLPRQDIMFFKEVRDEAHRFARGYYEKLHRKQLIS